ncbi:MAG: hypothetical protein ACLSUW_02665 [Akkermansia sp.]
MAENASISSLLDRVARTAPFHRELAKLGTEEQAVFDHTALPGVPFVAALCINSVPDTCRTWVVTPHLRAQEALAAQLETGSAPLLFIPEKEVALGEEMGPGARRGTSEYPSPHLFQPHGRANHRFDGRQPER